MSASLMAALRLRVAPKRWAGVNSGDRGSGPRTADRPRRPEHGSESAWIVVAQHDAVAEFQVDVIVGAPRRRIAIDPEATRHSEVHDQGSVPDPKKKVLAAAIDAIDDTTDQPPGKVPRNRPAQPPVVYPYGGHFLPFYVRRHSAPRRFDLGKLGHCGGTGGFVTGLN